MEKSRRAEFKKSTSSSVKCDGSMFSLIEMAWCIMNSCHKIVRSIRNTTLKLCIDGTRQFVRNAQNCRETNHGFCTVIMHQLTHCCLCVSFKSKKKKKSGILPQPPYSPDLAPAKLFFFSLKTEDTVERKTFCYD